MSDEKRRKDAFGVPPAGDRCDAASLIERLGEVLAEHGSTPLMRRVGRLATSAGRAAYFNELGLRLGREAGERARAARAAATPPTKDAPGAAAAKERVCHMSDCPWPYSVLGHDTCGHAPGAHDVRSHPGAAADVKGRG